MKFLVINKDCETQLAAGESLEANMMHMYDEYGLGPEDCLVFKLGKPFQPKITLEEVKK